MYISTLKYICIFFERMDLFLIQYFYFTSKVIIMDVRIWNFLSFIGSADATLVSLLRNYQLTTIQLSRNVLATSPTRCILVAGHDTLTRLQSTLFFDTILTADIANCCIWKILLWSNNTWIHFSSFYKMFYFFVMLTRFLRSY